MSVWNLKPTKGEGGAFAKAPAGNHPAVLVAIVDMGTQKNDFQGQTKWQHRAFFVWELVAEKQEGTDKNHVIGIDLTLSLNDKATLYKWIAARLGKPVPDGEDYDLSKELGQPCLLNVTEKNGYPKVSGVSAVPKGFAVPAPQHQPYSWHLSQAADGLVNIPDWIPYLYGKPIGDHIKQSRELGGDQQPTGALVGEVDQTDIDESIPF